MLKWTKDEPDICGWYWLKHPEIMDGKPQVVEIYDQVFADGTSRLCFCDENTSFVLEQISDAEWAGPIPEPTEDK